MYKLTQIEGIGSQYSEMQKKQALVIKKIYYKPAAVDVAAYNWQSKPVLVISLF